MSPGLGHWFNSMSLLATLFNIAIGAVLIYLVWRLTKRPWQVCIHAGPHDVEIVHCRPAAQRGRMTEFFRHDLVLPNPVTILATKDNSGHIHTRIKGQIDEGSRQRIRNFLVDAL